MKEKIIIYCDRTIEICLYFVIFCLPFAKAGIETFVWTAISVWIIKRLLGYRAQGKLGLLPSTELNKALGIFIIINALAVVMSCNLGLSIRAFFGKILKFVILYFIVVETINDKKRLRNILLVMIISASLMVADAGVQYFSGRDFLRGFPLQRLRASFPSANGFGGWLIMFIPIFLGILATKQLNGLGSRIKKIALGALVVFMLICLVLTYSRGAWLGFILGLGLIVYYIITILHHKVKMLAYLLVVACLIGIFFITPTIIKERMKSIGDINTNLNRTSLWKEAVNIIEDFPVLGSGLNTYSVVARNYKIAEGGGIYPHNSFLQMTAETGLVGLASFVWILIVLFRSGFQTLSRKKNPLVLGILTGILAFLVQSFFDTHLYSLQLVVLFWFMMGMAVATMKLEPDISK